MHTRPDGDLENLPIEKCTARDLKVTLLHSASQAGVRPGCIDLFDFLNARRTTEFLPWFHICTDFHVRVYRTAGRLGEEIRSSEVNFRDLGVVE